MALRSKIGLARWLLCATLAAAGLCAGIAAQHHRFRIEDRQKGNAEVAHLTAAGQNQTAASTNPEPPRVLLDTTYVPPQGRVINVAAGNNLQSAIDNAQPGDTIALQPGATYIGNFYLPVKNGSDWIVIRSAAPDSRLPQPGTRVTPLYSAALPKIITPNYAAAIETEPGAHHFRLLGLEIAVAPNVPFNYGIIKLGDGTGGQQLLEQTPTDLIIDRCYVHGNQLGDISRGIALNSARTAVIDSYVSECHSVGFDAQAICGWNGPGPFKIVNNYLEGAGENFLLGGADPDIPGLIPSDIEFRLNHLYKPLKWRVGDPAYAGVHWTVKNLFELKSAQRILIDGNVMENNWADAQDGFAVNMKSINQDGNAPWSATRDVIFTNNIVRHSGAGIKLLGYEPQQPGDRMSRVLIRNNLWEDIDGFRWGGTNGRFFQISDTPDVTVDHNTVLHTGDVITVYGLASPNFVYTNNISAHNFYGVKGDSTETGNVTLNTYMPGAIFSRNVLAGGPDITYPANNFFPATLSDAGFFSWVGGIYRLSASSPFKGAGTDGKDLGCDFDAIDRITAKVAIPLPTLIRAAAPRPAGGN